MFDQTRDPLLSGLETHRSSRLQFRIVTLALAAALIMAMLIVRLFFLQVVQGESLREQAHGNRLRSTPLLAPRGNIYDQTGKVLASNQESHALFFDPRRLSNPQIYQTLQTLAQYLETDFESLRDRLDFEALQPVYLYHDLSPEKLALILEHRERLPGITISTNLERHYPAREKMTHFLGHMGQISSKELKDPTYRHYFAGTMIGKGGLERNYELFLKGADGKNQEEIALDKNLDSKRITVPPIPGHRLQLTIDLGLQNFCYQQLKQSGVAGSIVIMDPKNGEVRALVSYPAYDPQLFNQGLSQKQWQDLQNDRLHPFLDRSTNSYAPGSIFKVITTLAGLGTGKLSPERRFSSRGSLRVAGHLFNDWNRAGFGNVDIYDALAFSIDTVFYELSQEMGIEPIRDYALALGLGQKTGIDLPQEGVGIVPDREWKKKNLGQDWQPGDSVNASIGQGYVQMTPLQATRMISAVANGGYLVTPHLVQSISGQPGLSLHPNAQLKAQKIPNIPHEHWQVVQQGLEEAVSRGTVKGMQVPGVRVAGKTGTAETIPGQPNHAWIVGYAPVENPQYAITVFLEHGKSGGGKAAPLGGRILNYLFKRSS